MPQADSTDSTFVPISRQVVEAQVELLIDLLDQLDDPDAEPCLGWSTLSGHHLESPEGLIGGADDREGDDEREPPEDGEPSLGWTEEGRLGHPHSWDSDREADAGSIRKPRPRSKTGGDVFRGTAALGLSEPPKNPRDVPMPVRKKGAAR